LHAKPQVPPLHEAVALATPVVQGVAHVPQLFKSDVVFTQTPLQSVGVAAGQVHTELVHCSPPLQACAEPQPPQLLLSVERFTHSPLQRENPLLHEKAHALFTQVAVALAMPVEHAVEHVPQWLTLLVVSVQVPLHSVGVAAGQPETHEEFEHTGVPPLHANADPQPPQLLLFVCSLTHAPLHRVNPLSHAKPHALLTHVAAALATLVEQALPQLLQLLTSLVVSTQLPLHVVGAADGQPETHEYAVPDPTHTGALPVHALPHFPQLAAVVSCTQAPLQGVYPVSQANVHALLTHTAWELATLVVQA
jgi:hypothetical protein